MEAGSEKRAALSGGALQTVAAAIELMRPKQWLKNAFVLAPLFFGRSLGVPLQDFRTACAFVAFCLTSSAVYIFNDWRDIDADRAHAVKKFRPLASGRVALGTAFALMGVLVASTVAVVATSALSSGFDAVLGLYVLINLSYSLGLKHVSLVELFLVASGFVLRLLAGGLALHEEQSPWIIAATATVALLLTVGKRRGDLARDLDLQKRRQSLEGYSIEFLNVLLSALTGATLVVYLLFAVSDYAVARYGRGVMITVLPVAFGTMRYVQLVIVRGDGHSPTDLLLRDSPIILSVIVFVAMFGALVYLK